MTAAIAWENKALTGTLTATYDASTAGNVQPVSNLLDGRLDSVWRNTGPFDLPGEPLILSWNSGFPTARPIGIVSLLNARLPWHQWQVRVFTGATLVWESSVMDPYPAIDFVTSPLFDFTPNQHCLTPPGTLGTRVEILISVETDPEDMFEAGGLWIGPLFRFGILKNFELDVREAGSIAVSEGRQGYPDSRPRYRQLAMEMSSINFDTAFGTDSSTSDLQSILAYLGFSRPALVFPRIDTQRERFRLGFFGFRPDQRSPILSGAGNNFRNKLIFEELR